MDQFLENITPATILVDKLRLRTYIGFNNWEREKLQDIVVSFSFTYNTYLASHKDNVDFAINYKTITKEVINLVDNKHFDLLEALGETIYEYIKKLSIYLYDISVTIEKPHALRFADNVIFNINSKDRYNKVVIAIGSNIDPDIHCHKATQMMQNLGFVTKKTALLQTKPLKFEEQADFLNGAILLYTQKSFIELNIHLKQIEIQLGRVKEKNKNAPRVIDLDIISFNDIVLEDEIKDFPFMQNFLQELQSEV